MQNLHGLFAWFWVQYIGEFRGGGAGPPFIFRPNLNLQGRLTKIIFDGGGGPSVFFGCGWQIPHLLEDLNLPLQLIELVGLVPCSIPVISGLKIIIFLCWKDSHMSSQITVLVRQIALKWQQTHYNFHAFRRIFCKFFDT